MTKKYLLAVAALLAVLTGEALTAAAEGQGQPQGQDSSKPQAQDSNKPYKVVDGNKVDPMTLKGFRAWRAAACERCHGNAQQGLVGPSLLESLKRLSPEEVKTTILEGRPEKGMPSHKNMKTVSENIDGLYDYLKGRSDGAIKPGRLEPIPDDAGTQTSQKQ
ncbi:MAG: c-type cytochrome [Sulfurifustaceae bacterium]